MNNITINLSGDVHITINPQHVVSLERKNKKLDIVTTKKTYTCKCKSIEEAECLQNVLIENIQDLYNC